MDLKPWLRFRPSDAPDIYVLGWVMACLCAGASSNLLLFCLSCLAGWLAGWLICLSVFMSVYLICLFVCLSVCPP